MGLDRLKARWKVDTTLDLVIVFTVFSLAGSSIMFVKRPLFHVLHIPPDVTLWIRIPMMVCIYQVMLVAWGTLFGRFRYFWEKEKKLGRFLFGWMRRARPPEPAQTAPKPVEE
jgi:hypothetical protein